MNRLPMSYLERLPGAILKKELADSTNVSRCVCSPHTLRKTTATLLLDSDPPRDRTRHWQPKEHAPHPQPSRTARTPPSEVRAGNFERIAASSSPLFQRPTLPNLLQPPRAWGIRLNPRARERHDVEDFAALCRSDLYQSLIHKKTFPPNNPRFFNIQTHKPHPKSTKSPVPTL